MRTIGVHHPCFLIAEDATPAQAAAAGADGVIDADPADTVKNGLLHGVRVDASEEPLAGQADFLILGDGEITNRPFIEMCARLGLLTLMGTGGASLKEVTRAVGWFQLAFRQGEIKTHARRRLQVEDGSKLVLLHGSLLESPREADHRLRAMERMHGQSFIPVGFEDRSGTDDVAALAVAAGAIAVVRRYDETFGNMVKAVRRAERVLGEPRKQPLPGEADQVRTARRRIVAARELPPGHVLAREDLAFEPPAPDDGEFAPYHLEAVLGREVQMEIKPGEAVTSEALGGGVPEPPPWFSPRPPNRKPS